MIHYGDPIGSTPYAYPSTPPGLANLWDRVGMFLGQPMVMLSPRHFAFVNHVGGSVGDKAVIGGKDYPSLLVSSLFASDISGWQRDVNGGGNCTLSWNVGGWLDASVTSAGANTWIRHSGTTSIPIPANGALWVKVRAKSSSASGIFRVQVYSGSYLADVTVRATSIFQDFLVEVPLANTSATTATVFFCPANETGIWSFDNVEIRIGTSFTTTAKASSGDVCVYTLNRDVQDLVENGIRKPIWFRCAAFDGDTTTEREMFAVGRFTPKASVITGGSGTQGWNVNAITSQLCWGRQEMPLKATAATSTAVFDGNKGNEEIAIHTGDSGIPFLCFQNNEWRLAGLGYAVDTLVWGTTYAGRQNAVVFNRNGLFGTSTVANTQTNGQLNYHHSTAGFRSFIAGIVPDAFDFTTPPLGEEVKKIAIT